MTTKQIPSFRELMLDIISKKFGGQIDPRAELDNELSKKLIDIQNAEIDLAEVSETTLQALKDAEWEKLLI